MQTAISNMNTNSILPNQITEVKHLAGESLIYDVIGVIGKPVVTADYSPLTYTSFGTVTNDSIKPFEANLFSLYATNITTTLVYFQIHNKVSAPVTNDIPLRGYPLPGGSPNNPGVLLLTKEYFTENGIYLPIGLAFGISSTQGLFTDAGTASNYRVEVNYL